jgi:hypothetical protein
LLVDADFYEEGVCLHGADYRVPEGDAEALMQPG